MEAQEFFSSYQIKTKFDREQIGRVQSFLKDEDFDCHTAAAAVILLSSVATDSDLQNFGRGILNTSTDYREPESLVFVLAYTLSDPLNAATVEALIFDRMASKVVMQFVDGEQAFINIGIPINPDWQAKAGINWSGQDLISLAVDLQQKTHKGELISDNEFEKIVKEHDKENNLN